jgi:CheY-like chemotaxis protein
MSVAANTAVLVVDDVAENRDLLVRRLKRLGIAEIEQAGNGIEALAAIERRRFDLVLLDIMMPELDGFGVLERLKANGHVNDLPIAVISAHQARGTAAAPGEDQNSVAGHERSGGLIERLGFRGAVGFAGRIFSAGLSRPTDLAIAL